LFGFPSFLIKHPCAVLPCWVSICVKLMRPSFMSVVLLFTKSNFGDNVRFPCQRWKIPFPACRRKSKFSARGIQF
jgi:hypothetical protein